MCSPIVFMPASCARPPRSGMPCATCETTAASTARDGARATLRRVTIRIHPPLPTTASCYRTRVPTCFSAREVIPLILLLHLSLDHALHVLPFASQVFTNGAVQSRVGQMMNAVGQRRVEPARPFVLASGSRLEQRQLAL